MKRSKVIKSAHLSTPGVALPSEESSACVDDLLLSFGRR